ncbi:MAG: hypothetical protein LKJ29_01070 [Lactobacillus sp.]|jgi:predicted small secreted protein|uniref:Uncharacterized protein n=1 Tax=Lacticaseibacillus suilingensis TaxID=2799577 RepID=A0ABW4BFK1_9LACO|nr:hypothetical protein [Lacticaseibacillus suilingensis]MCI1894870.1 hypothetical protein [Lactobacillus sp.]MCI1917466.1 hypothetical protein [Lactobacillus sp.]MCI1940621.1 hypothetical protein [Lactobacillus sp.]MCI1971307.1 hypothetical protein [Lactobacillus sp.]MCI2017782.1 hypothetical protein [Lactobacillus sp.]
MKKSHQALAFVATATLVGLGAQALNHLYWHRLLPNRLFNQIKPVIVEPAQITGGWMTMAPEAALVAGKIVASYRGGVTTDHDIYRFQVSESGTILSLNRAER